MFIIHCLSKLSITDHTVLENTIIPMTQPGKMSSGVTICIYTDTSHKQRIHRWLQPVQSLNQCKRGPRPGYSTWEGPSLVFLSLCHKGKELGGQGTSSRDTICFPTSSPCFWCLRCWNSLPRCCQTYIQGLYQQFPRLTFQNVDHISSVIMPRL